MTLKTVHLQIIIGTPPLKECCKSENIYDFLVWGYAYNINPANL